MARKKKPIWARILIWLFSTIFSLTLLVAGYCVYLYFAKGINVIEIVKDVKILNQSVNLSEIVTNPWTQADLDLAKSKIEGESIFDGDELKLSDKEISAFIDYTIHSQEEGLKANIGSSEVNLIDYGFEVLQVRFDVPDDDTIWTNFNVVVKVEIEKFKKEKMSGFPLNLLTKNLPDILYISSNLEVNKKGLTGYKTESIGLAVNNLTIDQTNELFKGLNAVIGLGEASTFNHSIGDSFVNVLLGYGGIFDQLKTAGAKRYFFESLESANNFVVSKTEPSFEEQAYLVNRINFYPYLDSFNTAVSNGSLTINSEKELVAYVDYVRFYDVQTKVKLSLTYLEDQSKIFDEINKANDKIMNTEHFISTSTPEISSWSEGLKNYGSYRISSSDWANNAKYVMDASDSQTYVQQDYALKLSNPSTRSESFDAFKINEITKVIPVTTSEQLVWVLANGYKPNCQSESVAKTMYSEIKAILRLICDDDQTDIEKLRHIYEWLILNVKYDNKALAQSLTWPEETAAKTAKTYDSWYVEGVINNRRAVCEGIAKTFLAMARIEGIICLYVTGNQHAWNKVYVDGRWYGVDATHGNVGVSGKNQEVLSYSSFMFTDEVKTLRGYTSTDYSDFVANTSYNLYNEIEFTQDLQSFDLYIGSAHELELLLKYTKSYTVNLEGATYHTLDIAVKKEDKANINSWVSAAKLGAGVTKSISYLSINNKSNGQEINNEKYNVYYYTLVIG